MMPATVTVCETYSIQKPKSNMCSSNIKLKGNKSHESLKGYIKDKNDYGLKRIRLLNILFYLLLFFFSLKTNNNKKKKKETHDIFLTKAEKERKKTQFVFQPAQRLLSKISAPPLLLSFIFFSSKL